MIQTLASAPNTGPSTCQCRRSRSAAPPRTVWGDGVDSAPVLGSDGSVVAVGGGARACHGTLCARRRTMPLGGPPSRGVGCHATEGERVAGNDGRSRTYRWTDPILLAAETRGMSGQEFYRAWSHGHVTPPIASALAFDIGGYGEGHVEILCEPQEFHYSPYGMVHGGLAATLLDTATGCSIHTRLPSGIGYATLDLHVSYLRSITHETGAIRALGQVVSMGRRVAVAEGQLVDADDRQMARATATCLIIRPDASNESTGP